MHNRTALLCAAECSRIIGAEKELVSDGVYRVLATLNSGERSYRIFAELLVEGGKAQLRFFRFEVPTQDEWFVERKINVPVAQPELAPTEEPIFGAEYVLCTPVRLDQTKAAAVFGASGPPDI